jgi:hypothetical protein
MSLWFNTLKLPRGATVPSSWFRISIPTGSKLIEAKAFESIIYSLRRLSFGKEEG